MNMTDTTKMMDRSNIAEMPNPKAITVERVDIRIVTDGKTGPVEYKGGVIRNASLHPEALIGKR